MLESENSSTFIWWSGSHRLIFGGSNRNNPTKMNATATFATDMKEMMNNWNELVRRATELFPNDTDEQRFQRVSEAMTQSLNA